MASLTTLNNLCTPSYLYFVISTVFLIIAIVFLTTGSIDMNTFCLDDKCTKPGVAFIILTKFLFIIFWTWILNTICRSGYSNVAWFLFLLPYIIMIFAFLIVYELIKRSPNANSPSSKK
jgi:hypothetical protein